MLIAFDGVHLAIFNRLMSLTTMREGTRQLLRLIESTS